MREQHAARRLRGLGIARLVDGEIGQYLVEAFEQRFGVLRQEDLNLQAVALAQLVDQQPAVMVKQAVVVARKRKRQAVFAHAAHDIVKTPAIGGPKEDTVGADQFGHVEISVHQLTVSSVSSLPFESNCIFGGTVGLGRCKGAAPGRTLARLNTYAITCATA